MNLGNAWDSLKQTVMGAAKSVTMPLSEPDGFPLDEASPHYSAHRLINDFYAALPAPRLARSIKPAQHPTARLILDAQQPDLFLATEAILGRRVWLEREYNRRGSMERGVCEFRDTLQSFSSLLYRRDPCMTAEQAASLVTMVAKVIQETGSRNFEKDIPALLRICEELVKQGQTLPALGDALEQLLTSISQKDDWEGADRRRAKESIHHLLTVLASSSGGRHRKTASAPSALDKP